METKKYNDASDGISLGEILIELINKKFIVIGIVILSVLCSFFYAKFFTKPKYTACAKMLITRAPAEGQQMSTGDFSVSAYLIRDYTEIILDKVVLSRVADELNLEMSTGQLKGAIKINNPSNSRVLEIHVSAKTPEAAQQIANKVCEVSKEEIFQILNNQDTINIVSKADKPRSPSGPNVTRCLIYGFVGGIVIAVAVVFLISVFDDTIKGKKDVNRHLGLEVLSVIPYAKSKENSTNIIARGKRNGQN